MKEAEFFWLLISLELPSDPNAQQFKGFFLTLRSVSGISNLIVTFKKVFRTGLEKPYAIAKVKDLLFFNFMIFLIFKTELLST